MFYPGAAFYMDKIAVGPQAADAIDINASPTENVRAVAKAKGLDVTEVTVVVLERDRHDELIGELRQSGARVNLIRDGDVAPSIAAAQAFAGVDMLMGIGGTPEGVISAAAIKCLRGAIQGKLWPRNDEERQELLDAGYDIDRVLTTDDLVSGEDVFVAATGVTSGVFLRGVRVSAAGVETESIVMRSRSGTVRRIAAYHPSEKVRRLMKGDRDGRECSTWTARDREGPRRRRQGHPRRRRELRHDREAVRLDRPRVDRGEPARLPRHALHDAGARGVRERRHPLRRDDLRQSVGRRDAVRRSYLADQRDHPRDQGRHGRQGARRRARARR